MQTRHPCRNDLVQRVRKAARYCLVVSLVIGAPSSAMADTFADIGSGWQRYSNDLYGTEFEFPAQIFDVTPAPETNEGRQFLSRDATLEIFATENITGEGVDGLKRRVLKKEEGNGHDVTYSPSGQNWFVVSGFRGDQIFYEKYLLRDGVIHAFGMEFPVSAKPRYAPIIERIEDSFRVGRPASAAMLRGDTPKRHLDDRSESSEDPLVVY